VNCELREFTSSVIFDDMIKESCAKLLVVVISACFLALDCAGQVHLPLKDLEVVASIDGKDIVALDAATGSVETIFANDVGMFFTLKNDAVDESPWLDLTSKVIDPESGNDSRGLSDFVLSPDHEIDRALYVSYTPTSNAEVLRISRFTVSKDSEPTEDVLIDIEFAPGPQDYPDFGGDMEFGPDGFLYIATGDARMPGIQQLSGIPAPQALDTFDGKILRIDVSKADAGLPYSIPGDNPFLGEDGALPEIWAYGLQSPRIAFDAEAARIYVIDDTRFRSSVLYQEINALSIEDSVGRNFGWPYFRGVSASYQRRGFPRPIDTVTPLLDLEESRIPRFYATRGFVKDGVLHFATGSRSTGYTVYFAVEPHFDRDFAVGQATDRCCSTGFRTTGIGAGGEAYYVSKEGVIHRPIPVSSISPPGIDVSSTDNGVITSGWGTLQLGPSPSYLAVYYTIDGSEPTIESKAWDWENPPLLVDSMTVNAIAYHPSTGPSEVVTRKFDPKTAPVEIERIDTSPNVEATVRLITATPDAEIYYTLDGSAPKRESLVYDPANPPILSGPVGIFLRAGAIRSDLGASRLTSRMFDFGLGSSRLAGNVTTVLPGQEVVLIGSAGARIHYTLDGSEPTESSPIYSDPIPGEDARWIRTLSVLDGYESRLGDALYTQFRVPRFGSAVLLAGGGNIEILPPVMDIPALDARFLSLSSMVEAEDGFIFAIRNNDPKLFSLSPKGIVNVREFDGGSKASFSDIAILPNDDLVLSMSGYPGIMIVDTSAAGNGEPVIYGKENIAEINDGPIDTARFRNPQHVTTGDDGSIYVGDGDVIRKIESGNVQTLGGDGVSYVEGEPVELSQVKFRELRDIAAAPDGSLYVGDRARLLRIGNGMVALVAGSDEPGHVDGHGSAAALPYLADVAVDRTGNCYVPTPVTADELASVRRISPTGDVMTLYLLADPLINEHPRGVYARADGSLLVSAGGEEVYSVSLDDVDEDGVIDSEERAPLVPGVDDRTIDSDQDGRSNVAEHWFNSPANDPASFPDDLSVISLPNGAMAVLFPTQSGQKYRIEASDDLTAWRSIDTMVGGAFSRTLHMVYPEKWRAANHYRAVSQ
jgi:hypothetical protein